MKCPLSFMCQFQGTGTNLIIGMECLEEECAWWHHSDKCCILVSFAAYLSLIWSETKDIKDKMPHAGQFLK